jgi:hypothetical protein
MSTPISKTTGCWLLWLRADLARDEARAHWRGPHADLVERIPGIDEYRQLHFSADDHGFWPAPSGIGSSVPADWRPDGMPEVAYAGVLPSPMSLPAAVRLVFPDEANAFDRVLAHATAPRGGRWFRSGHDLQVGARAAVLIRRRPGVRFRAFGSFVHDVLGAALDRAPGALEVRTHVFLPYSRFAWPTPGVAHDNPPQRRYHAALVVGAADRRALDALLGSDEVRSTDAAQAERCLALHAYAVEETVAVVQDGRPRRSS